MLMAVVLCLSLFTTGALAASGEVETAAPVEAVEEAAPVEEAASVEEAEPAAQSAGVPVPLDGDAPATPSAGVVIEGYGGKVVYKAILPSPEGGISWNSPTPFGANAASISEGDYPNRVIIITCQETTTAGNYSFTQLYDSGGKTFNGEFSVLSLAEAKTADKVIYGISTVQTYYRRMPTATPNPQAGAIVALYTSDPRTDTTATPAATFPSDSTGVAEIKLADLADDALPQGVGDAKAKTYYLKEIDVPEGWPDEDVKEVTCTAEWETDSDGATTRLKIALKQPGEGSLYRFTSNPLTYDYVGFDLVAWTKKNVTWSETAGYGWDEEMLPGVAFTVYADEACETQVSTFTTDANGKARITAADFAPEYRPAVGETKTFYLKQSGAQPTEHGSRPMAGNRWTLTASTVQEGANVTITLSLPNELLPEELAEDGALRVYNERYTSLSFDIKKTVESKGAQPGTNTFTFLVAIESGNGAPTVSFTPKGGEPIEPEFVPNPAGEEESPSARYGGSVRCYTVPLTVSGTGTASGTFTISGWESELLDCTAEVYELGEAPADWDYADYMYFVMCPDDGQEQWTALLYDGMKMVLSRIERVQEPGDDGTGPAAYPGYDGNWYAAESEAAESVSFVNTYTKVAPAPTGKPAQSPQTGDEANLALWLGLGLSAALALGYVSLRKKEN